MIRLLSSKVRCLLFPAGSTDRRNTGVKSLCGSFGRTKFRKRRQNIVTWA